MRKTGVTQEKWDEFIAKMQDKRMALRQEIARDFEILKDLSGARRGAYQVDSQSASIEDSDIPAKLKELADVEKMIGKYPESESGKAGRC
jgi:hypothetical protein